MTNANTQCKYLIKKGCVVYLSYAETFLGRKSIFSNSLVICSGKAKIQLSSKSPLYDPAAVGSAAIFTSNYPSH
jgi:hypothetical protein